MAVSHDSWGESATFTTTTPHTFPGPTPVGTIKGVVVAISHTGSGDLINGVVSYGGEAMTRVNSAADVAGETGRSYLYFLGSGVPQGEQTISIAHTGAATVKWAAVALIGGVVDTEVAAFNILEGDQSNPQIALDSLTETAIRYAVIFSGHDSVTSLTEVAGTETDPSGFTRHDFGTTVTVLSRQTTPSSGSFTIGWTATSDDVAMVAAAIKEGGLAISRTILRLSFSSSLVDS